MVESRIQTANRPRQRRVRSPEPLNPFYYLLNFETLVKIVWNRYRTCFDQDEAALVDGFFRVAPQSRALFVRLFGRAGRVFRKECLHYREIKDVDSALTELEPHGLIRVGLARDHVDEALLSLPVSELTFMLRGLGVHLAANAKRVAVMEVVRSIPLDAWMERLNACWCWICLDAEAVFHRLVVLFFGNRRQTLSEFVKQDLGLVRFESYALDESARTFSSRAELEQYLSWGRRWDEVSDWVRQKEAERVREAALEADGLLKMNVPSARYVRRIVRSHAASYEWQKAWHEAAEIYEWVVRSRFEFKSASRRIHCLEKAGQFQSALQNCWDYVKQTPVPTEQRFFRFHIQKNERRLGHKVTPMPKLERPKALRIEGDIVGHIKSGKALYLGPSGFHMDVEQYALEYFLDQGMQGLFAENAFIQSLCALLSWDVIFADVPGAFVHSFQWGPNDLGARDFVARRDGVLRTRIKALEAMTPESMWRYFCGTWHSKSKVACRLNHTSRFEMEDFHPLFQPGLAERLPALVEAFWRGYGDYRRGFPDLMVHHDHQVIFVEVKGKGDVVQPHQASWHDLLLSLGFEVLLLHVQPGQSECEFPRRG